MSFELRSCHAASSEVPDMIFAYEDMESPCAYPQREKNNRGKNEVAQATDVSSSRVATHKSHDERQHHAQHHFCPSLRSNRFVSERKESPLAPQL
mmetsp:Transcript_2875/g.4496  ORF Transcript_2875/g.4496 Transcript_2875/m.4496 type:complete len:95 (+) Transcript_2875:61-345(+)